jgi:putative membrane protein
MHKIPVFKRLWLYLMLMAIYDVAVRWLCGLGFPLQVFKETSNVAYLSAAFGLLLVLRTNSAYERWWEGRRLWGQLVNESRNLCLKVQAYVNVSPEEKEKISEQIVSFAFSLKNHLRDSRPSKDLPGIRPIALIPANYHLPSQVALSIFETVGRWREQNLISDTMMLVLDPNLKAFMDISGACERIKSTPLPVSYRAFMRQGIALNLFVLPWCISPQLNIWLSAPLVLVVSYFLIGLELIAEDIEDPFGVDGDDLPLDQICAGIQKVITEITTTHRLSANAVGDFDPSKSENSLNALPASSKSANSSQLPTEWLPIDPLKYTNKMKTLPSDPLKH